MSEKDNMIDEEIKEQETAANQTDETVEETTEENSNDTSADEVKEDTLSTEEESYKNQLMRLQAEFVNYKKRVEKEKAELAIFVKGEFVKRFFPVLDDMNRLKVNLEADEKTIREALAMVFRKVDEFCGNEKIESVGVVGEIFDPNLHEALMQVPTEEDEKDHTIASVFEPGYKIGDKIIRFAKVQVYAK